MLPYNSVELAVEFMTTRCSLCDVSFELKPDRVLPSVDFVEIVDPDVIPEVLSAVFELVVSFLGLAEDVCKELFMYAVGLFVVKYFSVA